MKTIYLVHPGFIFDDENLLAAFETQVEAEAHANSRMAAGEHEINVTPLQLFQREHPASTVLFFESVELQAGHPIAHSKWSNTYWHYQAKPPTTRKCRVSRFDYDRVVVEGTDKQAVSKLIMKKVKELQKEANV
jgi:hypothetical protein